MLSKAHNRRDELAGLCFATPILAEFISWWIIGPLFFGAFFCTSFIKKPSVRIQIGTIGLSLTAIYIFHVVFFFATPSDLFFVAPVRKELIISLALITIYYVTRLHQFNLQQIIKTFFLDCYPYWHFECFGRIDKVRLAGQRYSHPVFD